MNGATLHRWTSLIAGGFVFLAVLLLTPRSWVDRETTRPSEAIPVRTLDTLEQDCLWCRPLDEEQCDEVDSDAASPSAEPTSEPLWLHPDERLPDERPAPCPEETPSSDESTASPSA
jgi:hypothetical protein